MEQLAEMPYEQLIDDDYVWVGTPEDIIERIEETLEVCEGIQEIGDHRQRRQCAALDGDQEPGALRRAGDAALQGPRGEWPRRPEAAWSGSA